MIMIPCKKEEGCFREKNPPLLRARKSPGQAIIIRHGSLNSQWPESLSSKVVIHLYLSRSLDPIAAKSGGLFGLFVSLPASLPTALPPSHSKANDDDAQTPRRSLKWTVLAYTLADGADGVDGGQLLGHNTRGCHPPTAAALQCTRCGRSGRTRENP